MDIQYALAENEEIGTVRETFFANQLLASHELSYSGKGDFLIDNSVTIEVGGMRNSYSQVKDMANSWLAVDEAEIGHGNRIPLWLFGFLN